MLLQSPSVQNLMEALRRLPGIGKRSAERMALHLLSSPQEEAHALSKAIDDARRKIVRCDVCCDLAEESPCTICSNEHRDTSIICVVEHPAGAMAIERGNSYRGLYHVLHGVLNPLEGIGPDEITIARLMDRLEGGVIQEVIVATNATAEGEGTALYLARQLEKTGVQVTRIAHGVPMGGALEYADDMTLNHALDGRTKI